MWLLKLNILLDDFLCQIPVHCPLTFCPLASRRRHAIRRGAAPSNECLLEAAPHPLAASERKFGRHGSHGVRQRHPFQGGSCLLEEAAADCSGGGRELGEEGKPRLPGPSDSPCVAANDSFQALPCSQPPPTLPALRRRGREMQTMNSPPSPLSLPPPQ